MGFNAQSKKEKLLEELITTREQILTCASAVPLAQISIPMLDRWSILDLLAHLAGWDDANRLAVQAVLTGQLPAFYVYAEKNWVTFNDRLVAQYRLDDLAALIERVRGTQRSLLEVLTAIPAEAFEQDFTVRFRGYKVMIGRLLQAELRDEKEHLQQVRSIAGLTDSREE